MRRPWGRCRARRPSPPAEPRPAPPEPRPPSAASRRRPSPTPRRSPACPPRAAPPASRRRASPAASPRLRPAPSAPSPPRHPRPRRPTSAPRRRPRRRPAAPTANRAGSYSLARQLGLGARRIVIDAGHGGHDPGTIGRGGLQEKDLVLDVALRLEQMVRARARGRRRDDPIHRRLHPPRGAHGDRQLPRAPTCSCRSTPTAAGTRGPAGSRRTS